jgi:hypothetical protein
VEAFLVKARDRNANKTLLVAVAGFQQGAIDVAKRHGIDLFTVTFDIGEPTLSKTASMIVLRKIGTPGDIAPSIVLGEPGLINNIDSATLVYADGRQAAIPDEPSQMYYYCRKTKLSDDRALLDILQGVTTTRFPQLGERIFEEVVITPPRFIEPPDEYFFPRGLITAIKCIVTGRHGRAIRGNMLVDPNSFTYPVVYANVISGETSRFRLEQLPLGVNRVSAGCFYFIPHPLMYYYCASIAGDLARLHLIESFQNGEKITATVTQNVKYSTYYIPVTDKSILERLRGRLSDYLTLHKT